MEGSAIDIVVFAPLAPILGVLLFWFLELLFTESQKFLLEKIRPKHEPLCRFTNFLGILYQTICHALGYTITKSGISDFYLSVTYGKVAPKKEKHGLFEWVSNVFLFVGPFYLPALLLFIFAIFLITNGFDTTTPSYILNFQYTTGGQLTAFGTNLNDFARSFFGFLGNIDLFHPAHLGYLFLLIFFGLGIRPSYIGEKKIDKVDMIYDLKNIWSLIRHKPLYFIILISICYVFFYINLYLNQNFYVVLFSFLGWLSIVSIAALIITHLIIVLIYSVDKLEGKIRFLPYVVIILSYVLMRVIFYYIKTDFANSLSLLVMIISTAIITYILIGKQTNKFKTKKNIKSSKKSKPGENDE